VRTPEYERAEFERVALGELHRILIEPGSQAANLALRGETHGGVRVERIYLDESGPEHEIAILFRDLDRLECLFGYGIEAVETPDVLNEKTSPYTDLTLAAQVWGRTCGSSLRRRRYLPPAAGYPAPVPPRPSPGYSGNLACLSMLLGKGPGGEDRRLRDP